MARVTILKAGHKLPSLARTAGDFEHWIATGMGLPMRDLAICRIYKGEALPSVADTHAVVITGASANVTDTLDWLLRGRDWLAELVVRQRPVLGICFGHQLLAQTLGGDVGINPSGIEVGTTTATLDDTASNDALFTGRSGELPVQVSHQQAVLHLPPGAVRLATTPMDANHAFRYQEHCWGVQFHPEFDAAVTHHYVEHFRDELTETGVDSDELLGGITPTPDATSVLARFAKFITQ